MYFEQADEQADDQAGEQADEHIITKLNLLFCYLYKGQSAEKIGLLDEDRETLKILLNKLELYVEDLGVFKMMNEQALLDLKIQTWVITELYLSPHRVLLSKLTRDKLILKYKKARKYIPEEKGLTELINYFMVCLQEELEEGGNVIC